jgi:hypothetical protein
LLRDRNQSKITDSPGLRIDASSVAACQFGGMPVVPHYACKEPADDTVICRFIDLPKFRDLFASEEHDAHPRGA